jgi:hypothetical protein
LHAGKFRLILEAMAGHRSADTRNFAIVGHASSGKTILSEAMLACSGTINRMGRIEEGTTVSDYHVSERQRHISTQTSLLSATWMDKKFNILDTPGCLDFMREALAASLVDRWPRTPHRGIQSLRRITTRTGTARDRVGEKSAL